MATRTGIAHVVTTTRKYKDQVYRTHLLRRSYREGAQVKNETLGNLSHLPEPLIDIIRRSLRGETFVSVEQAFESVRSPAHGHVQAVALTNAAKANIVGQHGGQFAPQVLAQKLHQRGHFLWRTLPILAGK